MELDNAAVETTTEVDSTPDTTTTEPTYESTGGKSLSEVINNSDEQKTAEELIDLTAAGKKFKWFDGKTVSADELRNGHLRQSDYTKKTQEIAQERKYYDNLNADLAKIKRNPALADEFKNVYPEKFHTYLDYVVKKAEEAEEKKEAQIVSDPRLDEVYDHYEKQRKEIALQEVNQVFDKLSAKYELANESDVVAAASAIVKQARERGDKNYKPTEKEYEQFFKNSHAENQKRFDKIYQSKIDAQKKANVKGADIGSGGAIPGQAPRQARNIKEATLFMEQDGAI